MRVVQGFSLIEVMISMLIASVALLGLAATQLRSLQYATNSFDYTVSLILSQNAMEQIWSQLCTIQQVQPTYYNNASFQDLLLAPPNLRSSFTVVVPSTYSNSMPISVTWVDTRVNTDAVNNTDQVTINATFVNVRKNCIPTAIL
ncbi:type IV pilus modification PilV family protein [Pseudoalteromonas sp. T1lg65]|uniref:type IV pilus modification PilV family protein n=1 Tax=Pseudoalteromonas sp. T1lg65 TaxID=2077101 RepID=UPI003F7AE6E9